jgi:opacity protein-like surface antigen
LGQVFRWDRYRDLSEKEKELFMKKKFRPAILMIVIVTPVFSGTKERTGFVLFFDAGVPIKGAEGRYGADFGKSFLGLATQARLAGKFYAECSLAFFPKPRPNNEYFYNSDGFEFALDAVWKFAPMKKIIPFVEIGLSYAWIISNNSWREIYYPDAGRETSSFLGLNAGGGVEYKLSGVLLLRLGGVFMLVPNDGEGAVASWGKIFIGMGVRI